MADIVAKVVPNNIVKTRFGDQNQPQVAQTIVNPPTNTFLQNLLDVDTTGLTDQSILVYDAASQKFKLNQTKLDVSDGGNF